MNIEDSIRNILMKENYKEIFIDDFTKQFFSISDDIEKAFEYVQNKYVNNYDKIRFIENICRPLVQKETVSKPAIITENFKRPEKYGLKIGQEFPTRSDIAKYTGKSIQTICQWSAKKWIQ